MKFFGASRLTYVGNFPSFKGVVSNIFINKGTKDKSIEFYRKALAVNPNYPNAGKAREILRKLTANP